VARSALRCPCGNLILSGDNAVVIAMAAVRSLKGGRQEVEFFAGPGEFPGRFDG